MKAGSTLLFFPNEKAKTSPDNPDTIYSVQKQQQHNIFA